MRYRLETEDTRFHTTSREEFDTVEDLHDRLRALYVPEVRGFRDGFHSSPPFHRRWFAIDEVEDLFSVAGTEYVFPALPVDDPMRSEERARRASIVDQAARVKYRPPSRTRGHRTPRPGSGRFSPAPGAPGSRVLVTVVDEDGLAPPVTVEGCVMFPAPRGYVWVSLWDGKTPIAVRLNRDKSSAEYRTWSSRVEELRPLAKSDETSVT